MLDGAGKRSQRKRRQYTLAFRNVLLSCQQIRTTASAAESLLILRIPSPYNDVSLSQLANWGSCAHLEIAALCDCIKGF